MTFRHRTYQPRGRRIVTRDELAALEVLSERGVAPVLPSRCAFAVWKALRAWGLYYPQTGGAHG